MFLKLLIFNAVLALFLFTSQALYFCLKKKWLKILSIIPLLLVAPTLVMISSGWFPLYDIRIMIIFL